MTINENKPAQFTVHCSSIWCYYLPLLLSLVHQQGELQGLLLPELAENVESVSWEGGKNTDARRGRD